MNEIEQFKSIKKSLEDFKRMVNSLAKERLSDYSVIILQGSFVCSNMLTLLLQQNGYVVEKGMVLINDNQRSFRWPVLSFCARESTTVLPKECRRFIESIVLFRNESAHAGGLNYEAALQFSKVLDYFTLWFKEQYLANANIKYEFQKEISDLFFSLEKELLDKPLSQVELKQLMQEMMNQFDALLERKLEEKLERIDKRGERIENKIDEISEQIRQLSGQIISYQSLVERQIKKADTESEVDRLISAYTEECAERILETVNRQNEEVILKQEKEKLMVSLGFNAWNKLDKLSQSFLISAKVMYNHLILLNDVIDYSGVCVLVTKALEVELSRRFYSNFINYLGSKYQNDYSKYPTSLLFQGRELLLPEKYTMGSVAFTLCYFSSQYDSPEQKFNNRSKLLEYAQACLFSSCSQKQIQNLLRKYAQSIENIRIKYRNPSAHTNAIKQIDAKECFDLVLDVEKLLKQMLDSFDS